jgi:hypothetical protein
VTAFEGRDAFCNRRVVHPKTQFFDQDSDGFGSRVCNVLRRLSSCPQVSIQQVTSVNKEEGRCIDSACTLICQISSKDIEQ